MRLLVTLAGLFMLGVFVSAHAQAPLGPGTGLCTQMGGYPFVSGQCLNGSDLSNALELSIGGSPPQNAQGVGAGQGKLWLDTSVTPSIVRMCVAVSPSRCSTGFIPSEWMTWTSVDFGNTIINWPIGGGTATVASSGVVDLGLYPQAALTITGSATINSFGASLSPGRAKLLVFTGAATITYNANAIAVPSGANITTQAGGAALVWSLGGGKYTLLYQPSGTGGTTVSAGLPIANNNAALASGSFNIPITPTTGTLVYRAGFSAPGDGGGNFYAFSSSSCTLNAGAGDNGSQTKPTTGGGCWLGQFPNALYDTRQFGDVGNGAASSSVAVQNALNAAGAVGGGTVTIAATGDAHVITAGVSVPAGVHLKGAGGLYWTNPIDNTRTDWTKTSSWFWCQDTTNPCVTVAGNGASVEGLNFWYTQPTPSPATQCAAPCTFVSYTYTTFPYTILVANTASVSVWIRDNNIANASHCLDWEGPNSGISGVYSGISRNSFGCLKKGMLLHFVDNTLTIDHNRWETWWYQGTAQWWWAMESAANAFVAMDIQYLANAQIHNNEFSFLGTAMQFTDASVTSGFGPITFAANALQGTGNSFNEVCTAMGVANSTTHVTGEFDNTILVTDSTTSPVAGQCARAQPYAINLASDNIDFTFNGIQGGYVQSLAFIGGGGSAGHSQLHLKNVGVQTFSAYAAGANAMATDATGSLIDTSTSTPYIYPSSSFTAGTICSGVGCGSSAAFALGSLEIGGAVTSMRQMLFSQTVAANPVGNTIGQSVWGWRADTSNNLNLDRYSTPGTFNDTPIEVMLSTGQVNFNDAVQFQGGAGKVLVGGTAGVTCAAGSVTLATITVNNGIVTHC